MADSSRHMVAIGYAAWLSLTNRNPSLYGVPEDPATGSANCALAGLLASLRSERDLMLQLRIAQGIEMGRPSLLYGQPQAAAAVAAAAREAGDADTARLIRLGLKELAR